MMSLKFSIRLFCLAIGITMVYGGATTPGVEGRATLECARGDLEGMPFSDRSPVLAWVDAKTKMDGEAGQYRCDLRYVIFVPGEYNLVHYLRTAEGKIPEGLGPLPVSCTTLLPPGHDGALSTQPLSSLPSLSGYYLFLGIFLAFWVTAGVLLWRWMHPHETTVAPMLPEPEKTWADHLRPLVEQAAIRPLTPAEQGRLDSLLIACWRYRLGLESASVADSLARIRGDGEAGALLEALDHWIYAPTGASAPTDVAALLAPYRNFKVNEPAGAEVPL
jgi:hypothetical protein